MKRQLGGTLSANEIATSMGHFNGDVDTQYNHYRSSHVPRPLGFQEQEAAALAGRPSTTLASMDAVSASIGTVATRPAATSVSLEMIVELREAAETYVDVFGEVAMAAEERQQQPDAATSAQLKLKGDKLVELWSKISEHAVPDVNSALTGHDVALTIKKSSRSTQLIGQAQASIRLQLKSAWQKTSIWMTGQPPTSINCAWAPLSKRSPRWQLPRQRPPRLSGPRSR